MPPTDRPNEHSAGGVLVRPAASGWEVALIRAGRYWGLPKGRLEAGETAEEAAIREIAEECGIPLADLHMRGPLSASDYVYRRDGRLIFKHVDHFLVEAPTQAALVPQESEVAEAVWLDFAAAAVRASFADTKKALAEARHLLD